MAFLAADPLSCVLLILVLPCLLCFGITEGASNPECHQQFKGPPQASDFSSVEPNAYTRVDDILPSPVQTRCET